MNVWLNPAIRQPPVQDCEIHVRYGKEFFFMKKAFIIGAGPAGLTAAYELLKQSDEYEVTVFEESTYMGGISKTVNYKGNRMDMGGHRFFSKVPEVNEWWENMLPMQGKPAWDDIQLDRTMPWSDNGPTRKRKTASCSRETAFPASIMIRSFLIIPSA